MATDVIYDFHATFLVLLFECIGGSRGDAPGMHPPFGSRFFHFDMQNFQNVAALGVHSPPTRSTPPLWEILDLPLEWSLKSL